MVLNVTKLFLLSNGGFYYEIFKLNVHELQQKIEK